MSELQISLIVLGIIVIAAIVGFNWWQDRRTRRKVQDNLSVVDDDPLLQEFGAAGSRKEPGFGLGHLGLAPAAQSGEQAADQAGELPASALIQEPDSVTEVVIELHLPAPMQGQALVPHLQDFRGLSRRPVRLFLQTAEGSLATEIGADTGYVAIQLAVLMANRSGAITAIEWSQLWGSAQALAEKLDASVEGPEQHDVLERAARLDSTCATLDAQVGLTLLLSAQRAVDDVVNAAKAMGFIEQQGRLAWIGDHGIECFTLSRADNEAFDAGMAGIDRLTLLLDVPRSPANPLAFGRMLEVGLELSRRVGAELVDDQGKALSPGADVAIDQQLQTLYGQLEAAGLPAGSQRARRVFA
jgi:hypothetical protein